ncbi:hypothetical protein ACFL1X_01510 [Candidatus Hydrogenedentota bacterium]
MANVTGNLNVFLGAGGDAPRVDALDWDSDCPITLFETERGHSVYVIGTSDEGNRIAVGTKGGTIYVKNFAANSVQMSSYTFHQGAPVLSICFINKDEFVASDARGRCLLWGVEPLSTVPRELPGNQGPVYALIRCNDKLVGHVVTGELAIWELPAEVSPRMITALPSPRPTALEKAVYWPEADAAVFPAQSGKLIIFDCDDNIRITPAHEPGLLALTLLGGRLLTAGRADGCLIMWNPDVITPEYQLEAPRGTISVAALSSYNDRILLINEEGIASVFIIGENELIHHVTLPGADYRTVTGPSRETVLKFHEHRRRIEAGQLVEQVDTMVKEGRGEDVQPLLARLDALEFGHVATECRANMACMDGDFIKELENRSMLAQVLPNNPNSVASLASYAENLQRAWAFDEMKVVMERIFSLTSDSQSEQTFSRVKQYEETLAEGMCVVIPDKETPIPVLIKSATVLNRAFRLRCLMRSLPELSCQGMTILPDAFLDKYEQVFESDAGCTQLSVRTERVCWVSSNLYSKAEETIFLGHANNGISGLEFALRFFDAPEETVVIPTIIFDASKIEKNLSPQAHNACLHECYEAIVSGVTSKSWLREVDERVREVLGRLINQGIASKQ